MRREPRSPLWPSPQSRVNGIRASVFGHVVIWFRVVTQQGRLRLVGSGWKDAEPFRGAENAQRNIDVDFHGDIRLVSVGGQYLEYVARFTHGAGMDSSG